MLFSITFAPVCIPVNCGPISPHPCQYLLSFYLFFKQYVILTGVMWYLPRVLICISLMISGVSQVALVVKKPPANAGRHKRCRFDPLTGGKIPWTRAHQPTPVFLPGEFHGQRSLVLTDCWVLWKLNSNNHNNIIDTNTTLPPPPQLLALLNAYQKPSTGLGASNILQLILRRITKNFHFGSTWYNRD